MNDALRRARRKLDRWHAYKAAGGVVIAAALCMLVMVWS